MKVCSICGKQRVMKLLDFGKQPVSSHYNSRQKQKEYTHKLSLGQCRFCGVIQLFDRFPWKKLVPRYAWTVRYAEPEEHLDQLAKTLAHLPGITKNSKICGLSFKDDTILRRLRKNGFIQIARLDNSDLGIANIHGIETVQHRFTKTIATKIASRLGKQEVLIVRHLLEHVYNPAQFTAAAKVLLAPNGYLVIEVPGVDKALEYCDYTTVWEEHQLYFTRETFRSFFGLLGYVIQYFKEITYPLENSLLAIARRDDGFITHLSRHTVRNERNKFERFARAFPSVKKKLQRLLPKGRSTVLFGAGHLGCLWVNIFKLSQYINCFIDEDMHKIGMFMPGSKLPIRLSDEVTGPIALCLLTSNPNNEEKITKNNQKFFSYVRKYASIFPQTKTQ